MKPRPRASRFRPYLEPLKARLVPALAELLHTFVNPSPHVNENFGWSVSVSGERVLVGAPSDNTGATYTGAAYLYDASGNLLHTFTNPTPAVNDYFGHSVSLSGDRVLVGGRGTPALRGWRPGRLTCSATRPIHYRPRPRIPRGRASRPSWPGPSVAAVERWCSSSTPAPARCGCRCASPNGRGWR